MSFVTQVVATTQGMAATGRAGQNFNVDQFCPCPEVPECCPPA
ncbi:hypothetical protein Acr_12g0001600 [Actinidia rufa]|uniref:Uncharacterized protein n=1 Tax=Actinidia rufa TaxID=165716 RepID=A0A7J0FHH5_9ERIC|nr:hypothetical protein Acr_12g0001600 [Actinidia rufa]